MPLLDLPDSPRMRCNRSRLALIDCLSLIRSCRRSPSLRHDRDARRLTQRVELRLLYCLIHGFEEFPDPTWVSECRELSRLLSADLHPV